MKIDPICTVTFDRIYKSIRTVRQTPNHYGAIYCLPTRAHLLCFIGNLFVKSVKNWADFYRKEYAKITRHDKMALKKLLIYRDKRIIFRKIQFNFDIKNCVQIFKNSVF